MRLNVTRLGQRLTKSSADSTRLERLSLALSNLTARWRRGGAPLLTCDYLRALQVDDDFLATAITSGSNDSTAALIDEAAGDIHLKANSKRKGAGGSMAIEGRYEFISLLDVSVRTMKADAPANGLRVLANPRRYGAQQPAMYQFNTVSTPSTRRLPPGNYVLIVLGAGGKLLAVQEAAIGARWATHDTVDVVIP